MQFEAVLASAESKGDAPSRFELRSNPATDEVVFYVSPDPALPQKPRDYSHATRGGNRCATRARPAVDARCPFCPGNEKLCNADLATVTTDGAWTASAVSGPVQNQHQSREHHARARMLRFKGSEHFRTRLILATLTGRTIRIDDIRSDEAAVTFGSALTYVNETGTPATIPLYPGTYMLSVEAEIGAYALS